VAIFERDTFPRDKLCGEFLSPEAQRILREIGCLDRVLEREPARIRRARFTVSSGGVVELPLPGEALGISRRALDQVLLDHAISNGANAFTCADVRRVWGEDVAGETGGAARLEVRLGARGSERRTVVVAAALAVGAYGRRERLDKELGRGFLAQPHPYAGLKRHLVPRAGADGERLVRELCDAVEIHGVEGGYCGLNFTEGGHVNACMLLEQRFLKALPSTRWETVCEALSGANRHLARRLEALVPADKAVHSVGGVPFTMKERARWPLLFTGDAAGMIAPLCGDGQAMALQSAGLLAGIIPRGAGSLSRADFDRMANQWDRLWRRTFATRVRIGRWIQSRLFRSRTAGFLLAVVRLVPPLGRCLVAATRSAP
jgi:flavin-dependent dehydrogenase